MSTTEPDGRWIEVFLESLADTAQIREGLHDEEALPLIEWGTRYAHLLAARLDAPDAPVADEEQVKMTAYTLVRLMTRLTWLVTYRHKKDAAWLTQTFQMVNKLSRDLLGSDAPVFPDEAISAWLAEHSSRTNGDLLQHLMTQMTPPALIPPAPELVPEPPPDTTPTPDSSGEDHD